MSFPSGIVLLDKPPDITSFQSLHTIKERLGTGKVGHTGALDRFASGLLIACTGRFTRLASQITGMDKEYEAVIRFGEETDTLDPEGRVVNRRDVPDLDAIHAALPDFIGTLRQKPPIYSAVHLDGTRAHRLARRGAAPDMPEREVTVHDFTVTSWNPPDLGCVVRCSKGTYIRSLARDLGSAAGSCAYVVHLRREKIGTFEVAQAVSPEHFDPEKHLVTGKACFLNIPGTVVKEINPKYTTSVRQGRPIETAWFRTPPEGNGNIALFDDEDTFLALAEKSGDAFRYIFVMSGL